MQPLDPKTLHPKWCPPLLSGEEVDRGPDAEADANCAITISDPARENFLPWHTYSEKYKRGTLSDDEIDAGCNFEFGFNEAPLRCVRDNSQVRKAPCQLYGVHFCGPDYDYLEAPCICLG